MLKTLVKHLPSPFLNFLHDLIFTELRKRGQIVWEDEFQTLQSDYDGFRIRLLTEIDQSYTTTWAVYKEEEMLYEANDDFYSSVGEAEKDAIKWIQTYQKQTFPELTAG